MRFAALFFWIALPIAVYATYALYGLPHVIWSYSFVGGGDASDPYGSRHYTDCTFVGPYGSFTVSADAGRCGWFAFFTPPEDQ